MPTVEEIEAMPRRQLQQLAKAAGIRANQKSAVLVELLAAHFQPAAGQAAQEDMDLPQMEVDDAPSTPGRRYPVLPAAAPATPATPQPAAAPLSHSPLTPGVDLSHRRGSVFEEAAPEEAKAEAKPAAAPKSAGRRRRMAAADMETDARGDVMEMLNSRMAARKADGRAEADLAAAKQASAAQSGKRRRKNSLSSDRFAKAHERAFSKGQTIEEKHARMQRSAKRRRMSGKLATPVAAKPAAAAPEEEPKPLFSARKAPSSARRTPASARRRRRAAAARPAAISVALPDFSKLPAAPAPAAAKASARKAAAAPASAGPKHKRVRSRIPALPNTTRASSTTPARARPAVPATPASAPPAKPAASAKRHARSASKFDIKASKARGMPWKKKPVASRVMQDAGAKRAPLVRVTNATAKARARREAREKKAVSSYKQVVTPGRAGRAAKAAAQSASKRRAAVDARRAAARAAALKA